MANPEVETLVKEPYETTFRGAVAFMLNSLEGTSSKEGARANYRKYCRVYRDEIVRFMNAYLGRYTNGVRAVRVLKEAPPAEYDRADLYLEVYTEGIPGDSVRYVIICKSGVSNAIEVKLVA